MVHGGHRADGPLLQAQAAHQVSADRDPLFLHQAALIDNARSLSSADRLLYLGILRNWGQQVVQLLPVLLQCVPGLHSSSTDLKQNECFEREKSDGEQLLNKRLFSFQTKI